MNDWTQKRLIELAPFSGHDAKGRLVRVAVWMWEGYEVRFGRSEAELETKPPHRLPEAKTIDVLNAYGVVPGGVTP